MHNTVLIVLSVRDIKSVKECIDKLPCEKIWFKGYTEHDLAPMINEFVKNSNFENYFIAPDDLIIRPYQFDLLLNGLNRHKIVTGWGVIRQNACYTTATNPNNFLKNSIFMPLACQSSILNNTYAYSYKTHEINSLPDEFETAFTGWFYTGMKRHVLLEYPYECLNPPIASSDLIFSRRVLADKKYKQMCIKNAQVVHISNSQYISGPHSLLGDYRNIKEKSIIKTF